MSNNAIKLLGFVIAIPVVIGYSALTGWGFQFLWNAAIPSVLGLSALTFWQAWSIVILIGFVGHFFKK